ncbi:MAG: DUF47 family protein, partial [Pseudomonadota bacterium]
DKATATRGEIERLEHEADDLKKEIRLHLPKSLFMPVPREDLLELLLVQDMIANRTKDVSGPVVGRKMQIPAPIAEQFLEFLVSDKIQAFIGQYGTRKSGVQLFIPAARLDLGLQARRVQEQLRIKARNLELITSLAIFSTILFLVSSGLYLRTCRLERIRRKSEERFQLAVEGSNDGIWDWDLQTNQAYVSDRAKKILDIDDAPSDLVRPFDLLERGMAPADRKTIIARLSAYLVRGYSDLFPLEYRIKLANGQYRWILLRGKALRDSNGRATRISGSITDMTVRKENELLHYRAFHDVLTGLPNRALLMDRLHQGILKASRDGTKLSVIMMDMNRFKEINDTLGHHFGDLLLQQIAIRLSRGLRKSDTVGRLAGDEFLILLPGDDERQATRVVKKAQGAVQEPFILEGSKVNAGTSFGIAVFPDHSKDPQLLLRYADMAMYNAKRSGGGFAVHECPAE